MMVWFATTQRRKEVDGSTWKGLMGVYSDLDKVREHYPGIEPEYPEQKHPNSYLVPDHPYNTDDQYVYIINMHMDDGCKEPYKRHPTASK